MATPATPKSRSKAATPKREDLLAAIEAADTYTLSQLLRNASVSIVNKRDQRERTLLHEAATSRLHSAANLTMIRMLLDAGADLNIRASGNWSVLMEAVHEAAMRTRAAATSSASGDTGDTVVRCLIDRGATITLEDVRHLESYGKLPMPENDQTLQIILRLVRSTAAAAAARK